MEFSGILLDPGRNRIPGSKVTGHGPLVCWLASQWGVMLQAQLGRGPQVQGVCGFGQATSHMGSTVQGDDTLVRILVLLTFMELCIFPRFIVEQFYPYFLMYLLKVIQQIVNLCVITIGKFTFLLVYSLCLKLICFNNCRQKQIMIRSARFVHGLSQFSGGDQVVMQGLRKPRFVRLAVS